MTQDGTWSDESEWEIPDSGFDDTVEDAGPPPVVVPGSSVATPESVMLATPPPP